MAISLEADPTLPQGYLKVNGTTAATVTTSGITGNVVGNVTGNVTLPLSGFITFPDATTQNSAAIGFGQTWQNVAASRVSGVTYTNSTGRPIMVSAGSVGSGSTGTATSAIVNGITVANNATQQVNCSTGVSFIVPAGATYSVSATLSWAFFSELR